MGDILIENNVDFGNFELKSATLENRGTSGADSPPTLREGGVYYSDYYHQPLWSDGFVWNRIYPPYVPGVSQEGFVVAEFDTINGLDLAGDCFGTATEATKLKTDRGFSITGKATAGSVSFDGTAAVAMNVTALSVAAGDISLANGKLLIGNASDIATAVTKGSISLSDWGTPTSDLAMGSKRITGMLDPVNDQDAATRGWVLGVVSGVLPKSPVRLATTAALATYTTNGLPATVLTASANGSLSIDGTAVATSDRVLVKSETAGNQKDNGVYTVTQAGSGGTPWVLTRATDADTDAEVTTGDEYFVSAGSANAGTKWALQTAEPITLGTTGLTFVQTDGNTSYNAGNGLVQVGTTFHFAQSANYSTGAIPYATGAASIGFISAPADKQVLVGSGTTPAWGRVDLSSTSAVQNVLGSGNGGTGNSTVNEGDILYGNGGTWGRLAAAASGSVLVSGTDPSWGKVGLSTHVSGTLPISNGGTNVNSLTANAVMYGNSGANAVAFAAGTSAQIMQANGSAVPGFVTLSGDASVAVGGALTIASKAVSFAKLQDVSSDTVAGRTDPGTGVMTSLSMATLAGRLNSYITPTVTLTGTVTGSGAGSISTVVPLAGLSVLGVSSNGAGNASAITAATSGHSLRLSGTTLGFGAVDLANTSSTTGALPALRGGTGRTGALVFPAVDGLIARFRKITLASGASSYTKAHGFGNKHLISSLVDSTGNKVEAGILIDDTNVYVTFGRVTTKSYTLCLCGSDQAETQSPS